MTTSFLLVAISAIAQTKTPKQPGMGKGALGVVSVSMKVMKSDEYVAFVSWKLVVKNHSSHDLRLFGTLSFLDSEGYVVDGDDFLGDIDGGEQKTFTGEINSTPDQVEKMRKVEAKVRER